VFLFGQTSDNQGSAFATSRQLMLNNQAQKILCLGTEPMSGYPGYENWKLAFNKFGVAEDMIEPVPPVPEDTAMLHTRIEAESLINHAKKQNYKTLIVTAAPFQQPRAFMAAVTAAMRAYPELYLYSCPGKALPWREEVTHSQGEVQDTRAGLVEGEMERIQKYHAKGDLASVEEVLDYLNKRDKGQLH
jgi:hypothetical protein